MHLRIGIYIMQMRALHGMMHRLTVMCMPEKFTTNIKEQSQKAVL